MANTATKPRAKAKAKAKKTTPTDTATALIKVPEPASNNQEASKISSLAVCNAAIKRMIKSVIGWEEDAKIASEAAMEHCETHGDTTGIQQLYEALGKVGTISGGRYQGYFMQWVKAHSPVRQNDKTKNFGLLKRTKVINGEAVPNQNYVPFDTKGYKATSFMDYKPAPKATVYSNLMLGQKIGKILTRDYSEQSWAGDDFDQTAIYAAAKAYVTAQQSK